MNVADEGGQLPESVGGLLAFGLRSWKAQAPLYVALAVGVFAAYAIAEYVIPPADIKSAQGQFKLFVLVYTGLFADAFLIGAVALGVAARGGGATPSWRALLGGATERWLAVIAVTFLAQFAYDLMKPFDGLGQTLAPRPLVYLTAPITWLFYGILGLTAPFVALSANRGSASILLGFAQAFTVSLRRGNVLRLCVLGAITVLPAVVEALLFNAFTQQHVRHGLFWSNFALDAVVTGPITALQTAFALDFARRAGLLGQSRP